MLKDGPPRLEYRNDVARIYGSFGSFFDFPSAYIEDVTSGEHGGVAVRFPDTVKWYVSRLSPATQALAEGWHATRPEVYPFRTRFSRYDIIAIRDGEKTVWENEDLSGLSD